MIPSYLKPHSVTIHTTKTTGLGEITVDDGPHAAYVEAATQFARTVANQTADLTARAFLDTGVAAKVGDDATLVQGATTRRSKIVRLETFDHPSAPSHQVIYI